MVIGEPPVGDSQKGDSQTGGGHYYYIHCTSTACLLNWLNLTGLRVQLASFMTPPPFLEAALLRMPWDGGGQVPGRVRHVSYTLGY